LPPSLPPIIERNLELVLSNDYFGSGGSVDNFRTQQVTLAAKPAARWSLLLDHSVLTLSKVPNAGRTDQLSASVGYDLLSNNDAGRNGRVTVGTGFRSTGEFSGQRIQNGFHRLVDSKVLIFPYTDTQRTDATAWFDAEYFTTLRQPGDATSFGDWRLGAWWRINSLVTSDAQWDASAALYAVANRRSLALWFGLRSDWRSGYDDPVLRETAAAEDDLAVVAGLRFGALVIETVQQLNNEASYGQVRLISSGDKRSSSTARIPRFGLEVGFLLPDVHLHLAGRTPVALFTAGHSDWRESAFVSFDYGEPQHRDNNSVFVRSVQLGGGLEWQRTLRPAWLSAYGSLGAGWRDERLIGDGALAGEKSSSVGRAVLLAGTGIRVDASHLGSRWNLRIQLGVTGWLPFGDADLQLGELTLPVQNPALNIMLGTTFDFE